MQADYGDVVRAISRQHGVKKVWIPFLGLARMVVRTVHPEGVHDFQISVFEGVNRHDANEIEALLQHRIGKGFTPLVRAWSKRSGEWSFIYARPNRDTFELIVLAHDDEETALVRVVVDPEVLARKIGDPDSVIHIAGR
jgi:hypothetical protein